MADYDYTEADVQRAAIEWFRQQFPDEEKINYIGEQINVGIGYIDFLYFQTGSANPLVFEVKRGKAPKTALAQLLGYMGALERMMRNGIPYGEQLPLYFMDAGKAQGYLIAESLDDMTDRALDSVWFVGFIQYTRTKSGFTFERHHRHKVIEIDTPELNYMVNELRKSVIEMNRCWPRNETLDSYHGEPGGYHPHYDMSDDELITVWENA